MKTRITLLILLIILTMITAQYTLAAGTAQENEGLTLTNAVIQSTTATPTPASDESDSDHDDEATMADSADHAMATGEPGQIFQVTIATYLMDTAGFHAMDERLNQEGTIEASDAGTVNRVNGMLAATTWPAELQTQVDALRETLSQYAEALANDDVEAAKPLATQTHELQHDLSHGVEHWLSAVTSSDAALSEQEQLFQVTIATYLMDTAGFHAMDDRLNQEGTIEASDAGVVNRVNGVLAATAWPAELQAQVDALRETLGQYAEALANDDVEAAKPLATQTHELQHDLSHGIENWLSGMSGSGEHDAGEHSQEHDHSESSGG